MATGAGWFEDPWNRADLRWFDGSAWTEHVFHHGRQSVDFAPGTASLAPTLPPPGPTSASPTLAVTAARQSRWRRFRSLHAAKQVGAWIAVALVLLVTIGGIGSAFDEPEAKLTTPETTDPPTLASHNAPNLPDASVTSSTTVAETTANTPTPAASSATEAPNTAAASPLPATVAPLPTTAAATTVDAPATSVTPSTGATTTISLPPPSSTEFADLITGYGATREVWDQHHEKATGCTDGAAYKPLLENGQPQYAAVCCDEYIFSYTLSMPEGSTMESTLDRVSREFPNDAVAGPLVDRGECTMQEWRSTAIEEQALEGESVPLVAYFPPDPTYPRDEQSWSAIFAITTPGETSEC